MSKHRKLSLASLVFLLMFQSKAFAGFCGDAELILNWAERNYSGLFPGSQTTRVSGIWYYRYYPSTELHVGVSTTGQVGVLGEMFGGLEIVGTLTDFKALADPLNMEWGCKRLYYSNDSVGGSTSYSYDSNGYLSYISGSSFNSSFYYADGLLEASVSTDYNGSNTETTYSNSGNYVSSRRDIITLDDGAEYEMSTRYGYSGSKISSFTTLFDGGLANSGTFSFNSNGVIEKLTYKSYLGSSSDPDTYTINYGSSGEHVTSVSGDLDVVMPSYAPEYDDGLSMGDGLGDGLGDGAVSYYYDRNMITGTSAGESYRWHYKICNKTTMKYLAESLYGGKQFCY